MATIYDGSRVYSAADGSLIKAADNNSFQDQMILGMKARVVPLPIQSGAGDRGWTWIGISTANPGPPNWATSPYWRNNAIPTDDTLEIPLCFAPEDMRITRLDVWVSGTHNAGDASFGEIALYKRLLDDVPANTVLVDEFGGATPWNTAGIDNYNTGAVTYDIAAGTEYTIVFSAQQAAAARDDRVYGASMTVMYHKGT